MRNVFGSFLAIAIITAPFHPILAHAQEDADETLTPAEEAEVRAIFERGRRFFEEGNLALALRSFDQVYERLEGHPRRELVNYNRALIHDRLGQYDRALVLYRQFVERTPTDTVNRDIAQRRIVELEARIRMREAPADVRAPEAHSEETQATPPNMSAPDRAEPAIGTLGITGIALLGVGAAAGIAAIIMGAISESIYTDLQQRCSPEGLCPTGSQANIDTGSALAIASTTTMFAGLAALAVGGTLLVIDLISGSEGAPTAALGPGPGHLGLSLHGRF